MTPTPYSDIFDLALTTLEDYELNNLLSLSEQNFMEYMTGFLVKAISNFDNCKQDLSDRNDETFTFNIELTHYEIDILSDWVAIQILKKEIFDIRQIRGMIQNKADANRHSEAPLLDKKILLQTSLIELVDKKQTDYGMKHQDWKAIYGNN